MTLEEIKLQLQSAYESAEKLEQDRGNLTEAGMWALGYWRGRISILEGLLIENKCIDNNLKI